MDITSKEVYNLVFQNYPDIMDVKQTSDLLGVSTKTVYKLINNNDLLCLKVGREFRIPKINVIKYFNLITE